MANSLKVYADAGLTTEQATPVVATQNVDGSTPPIMFQLWLGSAIASRTFQASSNPGVDQIALSIENNTPLWEASAAFIVDDLVRTTTKNGYRYDVQSIVGGGVSDSVEPTWPTVVGNTVVDNEITWECIGKQHEITEVKIALTQGGLGAAVAGDPLDVGVQILSASPVEFWIEVDDVTEELSTFTELRIDSNLTDET
ncbi:MAG: hypothetical protein KAJ73_00335 [Zetaproteobacteria bacterium]|nr:hypothetical protein [Zetaproteobacteria bacterium]